MTEQHAEGEASGEVRSVITGAPVVKLLAWTPRPFDLSVAAARTCYQPGLIFAESVTEGQRDRIGKAIFESGHHTPFQHPTFVFGLEHVSRQFTWAFLHAHPFYNSEQSSQRYNVLTEARVAMPPAIAASRDAREVYERAVLDAWSAYAKIAELLKADYARLMTKIVERKAPILPNGASPKKIATEVEKKSIEMARYVVPIGAFTAMYHTLSGIELQRYLRMAESGDTPAESREVVRLMVEEVRKVDPDFIERIGDGALDAASMPENRVVLPARSADEWAKEFDRRLAGRVSRLVGYDPKAESVVADAAREVLGADREALPDDAALDAMLDPARNPLLLDTLNSWTHSPLMRTLNHANYTFVKKISHTADSQDQRHRMVPGSRPMLSRTATREPDVVVPDVIAENAEALAEFNRACATLWSAKNRLVDEFDVPASEAVYLLPNATAIRFTQTGSFLHLLHKWRLRTCFNAQEEIYRASYEEVAQVAAVHPRLAGRIGPPCVVRRGLVDYGAPLGPCPEGVRWCGVDVWRNWPNVKRPF
ncbi:MAG: FAD-dependent thymidylate synthase [Thermoplasmatota archaeon]